MATQLLTTGFVNYVMTTPETWSVLTGECIVTDSAAPPDLYQGVRLVPGMQQAFAAGASFSIRQVSANDCNISRDVMPPFTGRPKRDRTVPGPAALATLALDLFTGLSTAGAGAYLNVSGFASAAVVIIGGAGIATGAVIFESSLDGVNWFVEPYIIGNSATVTPSTAAQTIAASTTYKFTIALSEPYLRARISTGFTGGTVQATIQLAENATPMITQQTVTAQSNSNVFNQISLVGQAANAIVTGTARDTGVAAGSGHRYSKFNVFAFSDQAAVFRIEFSTDNVTWRQASVSMALSAGIGAILSIPVVTRYARGVFVNGVVASTLLMFTDSYTAA